MANTKPLFSNARSKIQRANRHIDELRRRTNPLDPELYEITDPTVAQPETIIHLKPTVYRLGYRPKANIAEVFSGVIGDAFNNIREAFDFSAAEIVETWGSASHAKVYFPFAPRKDLVARPGFTAIEQALPGFAERFLKDVRPEDGPNEHLWDFYTLHNDGKHNDFTPVVTVAEIGNVNATVGTNRINAMRAGFNADSVMTFVQAGAPIAVHDPFQVSVNLRFGKGNSFEDEPVIPTLTQVSQLASETIKWLDSLAREIKNLG